MFKIYILYICSHIRTLGYFSVKLNERSFSRNYKLAAKWGNAYIYEYPKSKNASNFNLKYSFFQFCSIYFSDFISSFYCMTTDYFVQFIFMCIAFLMTQTLRFFSCFMVFFIELIWWHCFLLFKMSFVFLLCVHDDFCCYSLIILNFAITIV